MFEEKKQIVPHQHSTEAHNLTELKRELDNQENFDVVSNVFKQLDDSTRLKIFWLLCHCEMCVINIAAMMNMSGPAVSHHLSRLKNTGLITSRRSGKEVYYKAARTPEAQLLHLTIENIMDITCPD
ncbi:MAG: winged helix-turn-helix transcriptional regulator [Lachnospiraceae bacterium]|nr:winged helix-turn-helix transcriptional regulator [Candidatus Equihabitans merdae]